MCRQRSGGTEGSNPVPSSGESATNRAVPGEARPAVSSRQRLIKLISVNLDHGRRPLAHLTPDDLKRPVADAPHNILQHRGGTPPINWLKPLSCFVDSPPRRGLGRRRLGPHPRDDFARLFKRIGQNSVGSGSVLIHSQATGAITLLEDDILLRAALLAVAEDKLLVRAVGT
jgi:hypothetical protein